MLAPFTSFLCEEVWSHVPNHLRWDDAESVHLLRLPDFTPMTQSLANTPRLGEVEELLEYLRQAVAKLVGEDDNVECMELAKLTLFVSGECAALQVLSKVAGSSLSTVLEQYLSVSECVVLSSMCSVCGGSGELLKDVCPLCDADPCFAAFDDTKEEATACGDTGTSCLSFLVQRTTKGKCQRCWRYRVLPALTDVDDLCNALSGDLCDECAALVGPMDVHDLKQQCCSVCGKHGHSKAECSLTKKRKHATKALAGA